MIRIWLQHTGMYSGLVAAMAFAALCAQLMMGIARQARPRLPAALASSSKVARVAAKPARKVAKRGLINKSEPKKERPFLRLTLSVVVGQERAEVFVNSRRVGETPYLGDYSCRRGEALKFEIVPKTGPLILRSAICYGRSLRIRD